MDEECKNSSSTKVSPVQSTKEKPLIGFINIQGLFEKKQTDSIKNQQEPQESQYGENIG